MKAQSTAGIGVLLKVTSKGEVVVDRVCEGSGAFGYILPGDVFTRIGADEASLGSAPFVATRLIGPENSTIGNPSASRSVTTPQTSPAPAHVVPSSM